MTAAREVLDYIDDVEGLYNTGYLHGTRDTLRSCATTIPALRSRGHSLRNILSNFARMADRL